MSRITGYLGALFMPACMLLAIPSLSFGQGPTGEINGTVTDATGAVIPNAMVRLTNTATGATREVNTNGAGLYSLPVLPPGTYTVSVEQQGFQKQVRPNITIQVQQTARVDFALVLGELTQTMEVAESAPLLAAGDSTIGQVIENKRIVELPLNGRNYLQLTALSPGVTNTSSASAGAVNFQGGQRASQSITVNGQRNSFDHFTLDGVENTDPNVNTYILLPSLDALSEFKVQTATYPAEYGFAITQINVTTKSGTNTLHGGGVEFLRNSWFDAKNFFDSRTSPIPPFRRNQFGGTLGGPVLKNKLFFMANYEGLRESKAITTISTVPLPVLRSGDFTGRAAIYDPQTRTVANGTVTAAQFPSNIIPTYRMSPISLAALKYYPAPNLPGTSRNYISTEPRTVEGQQYMARVDYRMNDNFSWYGRWNYDKDTQYAPGSFPQQGALIGTRPDQVMGGGTQIIRPTLVNDFRFGWTRFVNNNTGYNAFLNNINKNALQIPGVNPTDNPAFWGLPAFTIGGYTGWGEPSTVYLTHNNIWEGHDSVNWTRGKHILKFGGSMEIIHYNQTGNQFAHGGFDFNGTVTGNPSVAGNLGDPVADLLLGYPNQTQSGIQPANAALRTTYWAVFATDSYRLTPKLTLEYGLRYEYLKPFQDANDNSVNILGVASNSPILVRASNQGTNRDPYENQVVHLQNVTMVRDGRLGPGLVNPDRNNFAPRLGLAYSMNGRTVVRAGFGTFYSVLDMGNSVYDMARTLAGLLRQSQNATIPDLTLNTPFRGLGGSGITLVQPLILGNAADMRSTYVNEWTLSVQRSLTPSLVLEGAYVGSEGHRLKKMTSLNMPLPGPGSIDPRRPWQQFGYVQYPDSIGNSNYHALQLRLEQRFQHGVTVLSAYTFSKSIDDTSGVRAGSGDVLTPNNPFNLNSGERALSGHDVRHRWVTSGLVELPFGKGKRLLSNAGTVGNALAGGWQFGGILTLQSGMPVTPLDGSFDPPNLGGGLGYTPRPNATGISPTLPGAGPSLWFNKAAFVPQPLYTFGNAGRNVINGPRLTNVDLSLAKRIPFTERVSSELRYEVFNVANHPIFALPNANLSSAAYGTIAGTIVDSRQMQIGLRIMF